MPIFVATTIVLVLVALFAAPVLAARLGPPAVARPPVVAAFDTYLKLDSLIKGTIKLDISTSKLADKWTVTSLKCDDVTVVATDSKGVVATAKATPGGDPASLRLLDEGPLGRLVEHLRRYRFGAIGRCYGVPQIGRWFVPEGRDHVGSEDAKFP